MKPLALALFLVLGTAAWSQEDRVADQESQPRAELEGGLALGRGSGSTATVGMAFRAVSFFADRWGMEVWAFPFELVVAPRPTRALDGELGPDVAVVNDLGAGLVVRWPQDWVSPSRLNFLGSAGAHWIVDTESTEGSLFATWYLAAGAELVLGRPFVISGHLRWASTTEGWKPGGWVMQAVGTLGLAF